MKRSSGRYRGSRRSGGVLIPLLVVLCIAAAVTLYVINNNMTFTREGSFFIPEKEVRTEKAEANLIIDEAPAEEEKKKLWQRSPLRRKRKKQTCAQCLFP